MKSQVIGLTVQIIVASAIVGFALISNLIDYIKKKREKKMEQSWN
jgi:K+-transporting ATPase A subunit